MTITVEIKTVYGNKTVYPICDKAFALCALTGNRTLTPDAIDLIKKLGYAIKVKTPEL
jgi:hypothetical protein